MFLDLLPGCRHSWGMGNTARRRATSEVRVEIAAERRELADLLDELPESDWDEPTLCTGWRVRHVAAHMSMGFRYSLGRTAWELVKARGNLHRMTDRCARADAATHSTHALAAALRDNADHPWTPPVGGFESALGHDVVHGLDITVALGHERRLPENRLRILLDTVNARTLKFFRADLRGVQLRATDLDWTYGTGTPVSGAAQDLLLLAYGRKVPPGHLEGDRCDRYVTV